MSAIHDAPLPFDPAQIPSPAYVLDRGALRRNLAILADVQARSGAKVLAALKGFAMWSVFDDIRDALTGVAASSPAEAELGHRYVGKELHVYAPAYSERDLRAVAPWADHIVFNSPGQWLRFRSLVRSFERPPSCGLRLNPEHRETEVELYDPSAPRSRLGTTLASLEAAASAHPDLLEGLEGLHFHNLCEKDSDALERTLGVVEQKFGRFIEHVAWVNFGGGHHVSRPGYDVERLVRVVADFRQRRGKTVYLEPGEAVALHAGWLVATVLDVVDNGGPVAILDTSATAHMPDVLEMPYRPHIIGAGAPGEKAHTVRLGGLTCLAGDVIGDYSFDAPLEVGDRLVFTDMAHYSMVKNTTFNGVQLPAIVVWDPAAPSDAQVRVVREFGFEDYARRLS